MLHVQIHGGVGRVVCEVDAGGGGCDGVGPYISAQLGVGLRRCAGGDADSHVLPSFLPCGVAGVVFTCFRVYLYYTPVGVNCKGVLL